MGGDDHLFGNRPGYFLQNEPNRWRDGSVPGKPGRDDLGIHVREETDSLLTPLTETGAFHIERLRLNRPPLVALRRARQRTEQYRAELMTMREEQAQLRGRIATLEHSVRVVVRREREREGERGKSGCRDTGVKTD